MLELYHGGLTMTSKKVRLCLKEKGLAYRSRYLDLTKFEHHRPTYLAVNPAGLVPALIDDGATIVESMVINEYLDERYPEPSLRPSDALGRARMRGWTKLADSMGPTAVVPHIWSRLRLATERFDEATLEGVLRGIPLWERRERWRKVANEGFSAKERDEARAAASLILRRMEPALKQGPWLMGECYTLADIDLLPFVDRFETFYPELMQESEVPNVHAWLSLMRQRAAVAATYEASAETREPELLCCPL